MTANLRTTRTTRTTIKNIGLFCGLAALILIGFYFRWRYIQEISLYVDEFTTIWAARRILEFGWPIMPSGVLYTRGILSSYVEAAFLALFGFNYQVARLPSLLFGLSTIPLIFIIGWREWNLRVGWLAAVGLTLLPEAIVWSGRARFYTQLQFFVLLAVWSGLITIQTPSEKNKRWLSLFLLSFVFALYSQEETLLLYPAILLATWLWQGWNFLTKPRILLTHLLCLIAIAFRYALEIWGQPGYFETIQNERPYIGLMFELSASFDAYKSLLLSPERWPYTLLAFLALIPALRMWWQQKQVSRILSFHQSTIYFTLQFLTVFSIILLFVGSTWRDHRYLFIIQPFWLLLSAAGADWLIQQAVQSLPWLIKQGGKEQPWLIKPAGKEQPWLKSIHRVRLLSPPIPSLLHTPPAIHTINPRGRAQGSSLRERAAASLLYSIAFLLSVIAFYWQLPVAQKTLTQQQEGYDLALAFLASERQPDDVILTPQPPACALILEPCDYYAIQHGYEEYVIQRDGLLVDRWSGTPLLNSNAQLEELIRTSKRIWFVTDSFRLATRYDADFIRTLIEQFDLVFNKQGIIVLRAEGWRSLPILIEKKLVPPAHFGPLILEQWEQSEAKAGENLTITLLWQAGEKINTQLNTFVHLIATDGHRVTQEDGAPTRGIVPTVLFDLKPWPDIKNLSLPADLATGHYRIDIGAYELETVTPLAAPITLDWLTIGPPPNPPTNPLDLNWKTGIQLLGYDTIPKPLSPADTLTLRLVWTTTADLNEDLTVFIHLIAPDGTLIAQDDRPPEGGFYPTSAWDIGELVVDHYTLSLPSDAPKGTYRLLAGLYRPKTGERLQRTDGQRDVVELGTIEVGK